MTYVLNGMKGQGSVCNVIVDMCLKKIPAYWILSKGPFSILFANNGKTKFVCPAQKGLTSMKMENANKLVPIAELGIVLMDHASHVIKVTNYINSFVFYQLQKLNNLTTKDVPYGIGITKFV